jgi:hypothetical protein
MTECQSPECRTEFKKSFDRFEKVLYGEGPGDELSFYGILKKKVSYTAASFLLAIFMGISGFVIGFGFTHEARLSKIEVMVDTNVKVISNIVGEIEVVKQQNMNAINEGRDHKVEIIDEIKKLRNGK